MYIGNWHWMDPGSVPGPLDWVAFLIGGAGIGFTIYQLLRSRSALEAARQALVSTRASLIRNQLVEVLPQFQTTMTEIDRSLRAEDYRDQLDLHLERLIRYSRETVELIDSCGEDLGQATYEVVSVLQAAESMRSRLYRRPGDTSEDLTWPLRSLRSAVSRLHSLTVRLRNDPGQILQVKEGV